MIGEADDRVVVEQTDAQRSGHLDWWCCVIRELGEQGGEVVDIAGHCELCPRVEWVVLTGRWGDGNPTAIRLDCRDAAMSGGNAQRTGPIVSVSFT